MKQTRKLEWPTLLMLVACYAVWGLGVSLWSTSAILSVALTAIAIAQHSSLQHEVLHGHPFRTQWLNEALVFPALSVFISYLRFKDTHLRHHFDPNLTDPYDDPESCYLDPVVWANTHPVMKFLCQLNNTLAGRMLLGPVLGTTSFLSQEAKLLRQGDAWVWLAYGLHLVGLVPVIATVIRLGMPIWAYLVAVYFSMALLKIRTFLEHRAHDLSRARTVIVEDRGPLSYLFLNNNFHAIHHCMPTVPWYELPQVYAEKTEHYHRRTETYVYRSYAQIFRQFLFRAKEPVPHPIWPVNKSPD